MPKEKVERFFFQNMVWIWVRFILWQKMGVLIGWGAGNDFCFLPAGHSVSDAGPGDFGGEGGSGDEDEMQE